MAAEPYGTYLVERAYLSRLHAMMVNSGYRGKFDGVESVDRLFALLRRSDVGTQLAEQFIAKHGDGGDRTSVNSLRIADKRAYQAVHQMATRKQGKTDKKYDRFVMTCGKSATLRLLLARPRSTQASSSIYGSRR